MDSSAFNGIGSAIASLVWFGVVVFALLILLSPAMYFLGRYQGRQAAYREAAAAGVVREVSFSPKDGGEVVTWRVK